MTLSLVGILFTSVMDLVWLWIVLRCYFEVCPLPYMNVEENLEERMSLYYLNRVCHRSCHSRQQALGGHRDFDSDGRA